MAMSPNPEDRRFLRDLMEHGAHVLYIVMGLDPDTYAESTQVRLAAERGLDILSRAAARLTPAFKAAYGDVQWTEIAAVGASLAYPDGVPDDDRLWGLLREHLPRTLEVLDAAFGAADDDPVEG